MKEKQLELPTLGSRPLPPTALVKARSGLLANAIEDLFDIMLTIAEHSDDDVAKGAIQAASETWRDKYHPLFDDMRRADGI